MANGRFCDACGKQNREQSRFCGYCGQALYDPSPTKSDLSFDIARESVVPLQKGEGSAAQVVPYVLVGLLFISSLINYLDRINISVVAPVMMAKLGWDASSFGQVFSAFLFGSILFAFPSGVLADRWNAYTVLAFSVIGFSVFTALTPLGGLDQGLMLAARFGVGMFAAMSLPAYAALNARWFSRYGYGCAQTLSISGSHVGQILTFPFTASLLATFSWPIVFYCSALLGGVWLIGWLMFVANIPAERSRHSATALCESDTNQAPHPSVPVSPRMAVLAPQVLLLSLSYLCLAYGQSVVISWMPTYLVQARGLSVQEMGQAGIIPAIVSFVGIASGGALSDALLRRGFTTRFARAQGPSLCVALAVPFLVTAALVSQASVAVTCFSIYLFLTGIAGGGYWATPLELSPKHVGAISGGMVCAGAVAGFLAPMLSGFLVSNTQNWSIPFLVAAGVTVIAFLLLYFLILLDRVESIRPSQVPLVELVVPSSVQLPMKNIKGSIVLMVGGVTYALLGLFLFLWASWHSPHMGIGDMITQGMDNYILKEPFYTFILLFAAALGLLGITLFVLGLVAQSKRS